MQRAVMTFLTLLPLSCALDAQPFHARARVVAASGDSPVLPGAACTVDVLPEWRAGNPCRVTITCGSQTLYGGSRPGGYTQCQEAGHRVTRAWDDQFAWQDGDPWVELDTAKGRVLVRNQRPQSDVELDLQQPVVVR